MATQAISIDVEIVELWRRGIKWINRRLVWAESPAFQVKGCFDDSMLDLDGETKKSRLSCVRTVYGKGTKSLCVSMSASRHKNGSRQS